MHIHKHRLKTLSIRFTTFNSLAILYIRLHTFSYCVIYFVIGCIPLAFAISDSAEISVLALKTPADLCLSRCIRH